MEINKANVQEIRQLAQELLEAAKEAEKAVELVGRPSYTFHKMVSELPIERTEPKTIPDGFVRVHDHKNEVWRNILAMAKSIHDETKFVQRPRRCHPYKEPYFDSVKTKVRTLDSLTDAQLVVSAEMATEIAQIYNRYYMEMHPYFYVTLEDGRVAEVPTRHIVSD